MCHISVKMCHQSHNLKYIVYQNAAREGPSYSDGADSVKFGHVVPEMHADRHTYTLCLKKNDNDVLRYNFNAHQPILIIFGRDIAE